jgi:hypothetical protein
MSMKNRERLGRHALNSTNFGGNETGNFAASGSSAGLVTTSAQKYKRNSNSPLRGGSRDGSMGAGTGPYTRSNFGARSGSAGGFNGSAAEGTRRSGPSGMDTRPPIPRHDNYMRQKSPKSPSSLRKKVGSQSPNRDLDMRDASFGLLTGGTNVRVTGVSPVRTASNEYLSQLAQDNASLQKRLNLVL